MTASTQRKTTRRGAVAGRSAPATGGCAGQLQLVMLREKANAERALCQNVQVADFARAAAAPLAMSPRALCRHSAAAAAVPLTRSRMLRYSNCFNARLPCLRSAEAVPCGATLERAMGVSWGNINTAASPPVLALVQPVLPARPPSLELNKLALPRPSRILRHGPSQSSHRLCKSTEALCGLSADFARQIVLYVWPYLQAGPVGGARSQEGRRHRRSVPVSNS